MSDEWKSPPPTVRLNVDEVHVWRIFLHPTHASPLDNLWHILSADEVERAQSYILPKDRDRFVTSRGTLRLLLSRYLDCEPHELAFSYNAHGKPSLDEYACPSPLTFNLTHARDRALVAVSNARRVGIDLEFMRDDVDFLQIARSFFSHREYSLLKSLPTEQQVTAFYNAWTRKEAYMKARGEGLALLQSVEVTLLPDEPAEIVATNDDPEHAKNWSLQPIDPGIGYTAALAVEGRSWQLLCYQW